MLRTASAITGAAALAAVVMMAVPAFVSANVAGEKGDLADLTDCELRSWPYYARVCVRDETRNAGRATNVRIVALDRLTASEIKAASGPARLHSNGKAAMAPASDRSGRAPVAPSSWMMPYAEARLYLAAGDFVRRTVR